MHALHYANELLVRVRHSLQKLLQTRSICRNNTKKRVQTTINHISICFFTTTSTPKKIFLQSASCKRHCATHSPMVLDRLVRSEHAHASYPGLPGLSFHRDVKVSNTRVQPLHGTGRKESSGTGLNKTTKSVIPRKCNMFSVHDI